MGSDSRVLGQELTRELLDVTLEEFRLTESRFESDSRLGRELLYLLSNTGWIRRTTEVVDVSRVAAVESRVVVDVDPGYIAHEALRTLDGPVWLPLLALPRPVDADAGAGRPVSIDVTDRTGDRVAEVPQAEVGHQLAAALAETLVSRLQRRGPAESGQATRDLQVLLAAVLARLLPGPARDEPPTAGVPAAAVARGNRLQLAQRRLRERLDAELAAAEAEEARQAQPDADLATVDEDARSTLNSREAEIVRALRGCRLVVAPVDPDGPPTSFTVAMPARTLTRTPPGRYASVARIRVALLAPSTHADRVIEVVVPDGVRSVEDPQARIEVLAPQQFEQLTLLLDRMLRATNPPHGWVRKQLAELAVVKLHAAIHSLRNHYWTGDDPTTERLLAALRELREPLDAEAHGRPGELARPWAAARALLPDRLLRRLDRSTTDPGSIRFRATAIEEFTLRSAPTDAYVELVVASGDSPTLGTARAVNGINILVLVGVVVLLALAHSATDSRADVLATLLTIFPTLQASRLEQPDSTRLVGLLTMRHFRVGLLTAVPGLGLAAVLAFAPEGARLLGAAIAAVVLQLGCHVWIRWLADEHSVLFRRRRARVSLATDPGADHREFDVLRAAWCRSLTGEVLLLGRSAYPYVAVDRDEPGALVDLLTGAQGELADRSTRLRKVLRDLRPVAPREPAGDTAVNLLGVLRGTAVGRSVTFLVFRDPPKPDWLAAAGARDATGHLLREIRPMPSDRARSAPMEPPDWVLDVMIGIGAEDGDFAAHPLPRIARSAGAANFTLLNVQLPAPPPVQDDRERRWLRLRVGVPYRRGDSLRKLVRFLATLDGLRADGVLVHLREVPQMESLDATQTAPEDSFDELPGARVPTTGKTSTGRLVTDQDIRVPAGTGAAWRLVAVCAQPRAGLLADLLSALHEHAGVRSLAGAISGVFDGTMVIFLLCRAATDPADPGAAARVEQATRAYRTVVRMLDGVRPGPVPADAPRPLLRVQIRTPDRPGVMQDLLRELGARLSATDGDVDVLYALTPVVDGQALSGRLLLRLPYDRGGDDRWARTDWQDMGRLIAQAVARASGGPSAADAERTSRLSDDTVVTLDLVRRPSTAAPAATSAL
ncbi:MAG TPA: hypothetical protein VLM05_04305 [Mycobacteriales bacterium]|nr:hypothetical protein [Mycobacteriales bacterium]